VKGYLAVGWDPSRYIPQRVRPRETVRAPRAPGNVVSSVRASRSTRFGGNSATPCETLVRAKSTGRGPRRGGKVSNASPGFEYLERGRSPSGRDVAASKLRELCESRSSRSDSDVLVEPLSAVKAAGDFESLSL
jgi:hypothetical protein